MAKARGKQRASILKDVTAFVRRFVVLSDEQALVIALWVIHTHCVEVFSQTPYLAVTSPEKGCGKTRLIETVEVLVARPWQTVTPSEAVLFRKLSIHKSTLLLDEVDTIFNPRAAERYEGHRAILNAGHRRGNTVSRCVGTSQDIAEFDAYTAKLLSGIGALPETVADRSVPIRMERRKKGESVERFIRRDIDPEAEALREQIKEWVDQHGEELGDDRPDMPDALSDRMQEGCEPLVAIADRLRAGKAARRSLVKLLTGERADDLETIRVRLLRDIRTVFETLDEERGSKGPVKAIRTARLLKRLHAMEESGWSHYYGGRLEPNDLAKLLRNYGISSTTVRSEKDVAKGYRRRDLYDAWERYL